MLAVLAGMLILRETPTREGTRFDWAGFVLSAIGVLGGDAGAGAGARRTAGRRRTW